METSYFTIAAVERDTGLTKDVLRMWERRYGFPLPERDNNGERLYPASQVDRLRLIKRLMDLGHRPGKLIPLAPEQLAELGPRRPQSPAAIDEAPNEGLCALIDLIRQHDSAGFVQSLQQTLARQGLQAFVQDTIAPLTQRIGEAWEEGRIAVFEEHLFTELTKRLLRQALATLPAGNGPRIVLTSVPDEQHILGLLMAETLFSLEGAQCIPLGAEMPLRDIALAATAHQANIVALSFSQAYPRRQIAALLQQLRSQLPMEAALWVGGAGVQHAAIPAGVQRFTSLADAQAAVRAWSVAPAVASMADDGETEK